MIDAKITLSGKTITLSAIGHADFAPYGKDIVCAGTSSVILGLSAALTKKSTFSQIASGCAVIRAQNTKENRAAFDVARKALEIISAEYPENLKFSYVIN